MAETIEGLSKAVRALPVLLSTLGQKRISLHYDEEADVLYIHFDDHSEADDSDITDDGLIIRYRNGKMIGITLLNAQQQH